ncbi:CaiB/BaiF CoA transferase family protein [Roseovarius amoyensis]|uniref:CaiB/BaiF CoA transferase family protein n=1 Tax=Roseovarius amoyensis TaxID=2211448 RepID=UPI000DBE17DB|nr:CaiB/BaiF CoA-transferase family protein [Roseovarius amoyensis]
MSTQNDTTGHGPLRGVRILEIGHFVAAPFCCRLLADLGADVIKIEPPGGDPVRGWGEQRDGHSLWWSVHGRNKRSVAVNLKSKDGRQVALDLARSCDVVVENFRPGHLARLGLSDEMLRGENPDRVIAHVSGFGQDGPYRDRPAFGVIGEAIGGMRYLTNHPPGESDLPPVRVGVSIGDSLAGMYAAIGILAALAGRGTEGAAARTIDVALTESVLSLMEGMLPEYSALGQVREPAGSRIKSTAPTSAYPSAEGDWVLIAANSDLLFGRLCELINRPDLLTDPRYATNEARVANVEPLDAAITAWSKVLSTADLLAVLDRAQVPSSKIFTIADCAEDPQYRARGMVREVSDPALGPLLHPGIVPRINEAPGGIRWTGPEIGAHTEEVLTELLGYNNAQLKALRDGGAVA